MHEVLVNRLGGLSLPRKSVVRLTDRPDMTLDVYRGRKTTNQQINKSQYLKLLRYHDFPLCLVQQDFYVSFVFFSVYMLQFHLNLLLCVLQTPWSVDFS